MGIRVKKIFFLCLCMSLLLGGVLSCDHNSIESPSSESNNQSNVKNQTKLDGYVTVPFSNPILQRIDAPGSWISDDILFVNSLDELEMLDVDLVSNYDDAYFAENFLVMIQFEHAGGEKVQEITGVIVKDEMFCPVITIDSQENLNAVIKYSLVTIEVSTKYSEMEIGEILVINNYDSSKGSSRYNKID